MIFGVTEISFHNYTISKDQTRPKDENLDPIRNCAIPESVTNVKAFLGCTQQMAHYCQYYGLVAAPLHELTRDKVVFPKPWLAGTAYDISFNRLKSMMLNENLFLWNKVSGRRLFIEVDACEYGWGACAYQYADEPTDMQHEDEGRHRLLSKEPKRVVEWMSKAWTAHERELPCFYREALARLLCLEHFRNLIETQDVNAGTTIYTDHAPSTYKGSLSNKGRLSSWRIHETQDLADMVQNLYKAGAHLSPPHGLADALSRLPRLKIKTNHVHASGLIKENVICKWLGDEVSRRIETGLPLERQGPVMQARVAGGLGGGSVGKLLGWFMHFSVKVSALAITECHFRFSAMYFLALSRLPRLKIKIKHIQASGLIKKNVIYKLLGDEVSRCIETGLPLGPLQKIIFSCNQRPSRPRGGEAEVEPPSRTKGKVRGIQQRTQQGNQQPGQSRAARATVFFYFCR